VSEVLVTILNLFFGRREGYAEWQIEGEGKCVLARRTGRRRSR
jgi:hypothetical protein